VLAAFILGDEIHVSTRHVTEARGTSFSATLDTDVIELRHCDHPLGTSISIRLKPSIAEKLVKVLEARPSRVVHLGALPYGLYLTGSPSLAMELNGILFPIPERWPSVDSPRLPLGWHRIRPAGFRDVHWTYDRSQTLVCNGILVESGQSWFRNESIPSIGVPTVSVFDADGLLPLTLTRTALSTECVPFNKELNKDICRDIVGYCLTESWDTGNSDSRLAVSPKDCGYSALRVSKHSPYVCLQHGFTLQDSAIMQRLGLDRISLMKLSSEIIGMPQFSGSNFAVIRDSNVWENLPDIEQLIRDTLKSVKKRFAKWDLPIAGIRIFASAETATRWQSRLASSYWASVDTEEGSDGWVIFAKGKCGQPSSSIKSMKDWLAPQAVPSYVYSPFIIDFYLRTEAPKSPMSLLAEVFQKDLGAFVIPYNEDARRRNLASGFNELAEYVEMHQEVKRLQKAKIEASTF
jgi:hypothetical protein